VNCLALDAKKGKRVPAGAFNSAVLHFIDSCCVGAVERRSFRDRAGRLFLEIVVDTGLRKSPKFAILRTATRVFFLEQ
jgi:hypothetical protein